MTVLTSVVTNYQDLTVTFTEDGWFNATALLRSLVKNLLHGLGREKLLSI